MRELTHRNHFRFGYNGEAFNQRTSADDRWQVAYGASERPPSDFRDECCRTAHLIRQKTAQNIVVLFSGGADSEVVLRAFKDAGIAVEAAILRFKDGFNEHDIEWAIRYCEENAVRHRFYDLDILQFWDKELYDYAERTYSRDASLCSTMWLVDQIDGFPIIGSGDDVVAKRLPASYTRGVSAYPRSTWDVYEKEVIAAWYRHFMIRDRDGVPGFFQYTPEILHAFLTDPIIVNLVTNRCPHQVSSLPHKLALYQSHYPDLKSRPQYHGFEKLLPPNAIILEELAKRFPHAGEIAKTPYFALVHQTAYHGDRDTSVLPGELRRSIYTVDGATYTVDAISIAIDHKVFAASLDGKIVATLDMQIDSIARTWCTVTGRTHVDADELLRQRVVEEAEIMGLKHA